MKRFGAALRVPVRSPFRLDLTGEALRRLAANVVDVAAGDTLYRALRDERGVELVSLRAAGARSIELRATGPDARRWIPHAERMLGTRADLREWYARSDAIDWLRPIARALRGLKPPRYPSLWEACAHSIVFQQISIHAAAAIMRRLVEALAEPVSAAGVVAYPFPEPARWLVAGDALLRGAGLSANKAAHLRAVAAAIEDGRLRERELEELATPVAAERLCAVRGIGPWSAAVVLLRGLGRLDVFPLRDSGVARGITAVAGGAVDLDAVLERLGPARGMLYYHLLLARLHGLQPGGGGVRSNPA